MKTRMMIVAGLAGVLLATGVRTARADFTLTGSQELTVNTHHEHAWLLDQSRAYIVPGGSVDELSAFGTSTADISGGSVVYLGASENSTVNVYTGSVNVHAHHTSTVNVFGVADCGIDTDGNAHVNVPAGSVGSIFAHDTTTVDVSGGAVHTSLYAYNATTVNVSAGSVSYLHADHTTTVDISGGTVDYLSADHTSTVNVSGGSVAALVAWDTCTVTFDGQEFLLGAGLSLNGDRVLGTGILSGKWFDGTPWTVNISGNDPGATILAVPEPATLALLALGGVLLVRRRRT